MIRRIVEICLLLSLLCFQVLSETTYDEPVGLQIGERFISGPLILIGGNETVIIDKYTVVKSLIITDEGIRLIPNITEMSILPSYTQINETPDTFSVQLYVSPSQPIKAVEVNISFNPSDLQVINVTEGNLFDGYPTFFVVHDIDNDNGFLVAYGLIVGQGNTSDDGNFISITFNVTAQGASSLTFHSAGITNETKYVGLSTENAGIYIAYSWDIVPDKTINYRDMSSLVTHYGQSGAPGWIRDDINDDGKINYLELSALITHYGIHY